MANPSIFNREEFVRVTNGTPKRIKGRFAGDDYDFPPGEAVDVHLAAAQHIFGFGEEDKSRALSRLGWVRSSEDIEPAMARLALITFGDVPGIEKVTPIRIPNASPLVKGDGTDGAPSAQSDAPEDPLSLELEDDNPQSEVM